MPSLRACGARPSAGGEAEVRWPIGEGPEITRRWFPRRGAVSAPAEYSRADAKAFHFRRSVDDEPVAKRAHASVKPMAPSRACGARPSGGMGYPGSDGLTGETRNGAQVVFSEGRTLCVRVARPHECRGIPFAADGLTMSRWPRGHMPRSSPSPPCGRAEPAPPRGWASQGEMA
jgi:hypothetical protein